MPGETRRASARFLGVFSCLLLLITYLYLLCLDAAFLFTISLAARAERGKFRLRRALQIISAITKVFVIFMSVYSRI